MTQISEQTLVNITAWCSDNVGKISVKECILEVGSDPVVTQIINNWHAIHGVTYNMFVG
jgi:hypothetical protein